MKKRAAKRQVREKPLAVAPTSMNGDSIESIAASFSNHLKYSLAKDEYTATDRDCFTSLALAVRDRLIKKWIETQQTYYNRDAKRIYYLSLEFLIGRTLGNALVNQGLTENACTALGRLGYALEDLAEIEFDAGLGNGGLGRLAACFLDSLATLEMPAYGYGIRYEYGIFFQKIIDGFQIETPDGWLRYGNPWEIERPEFLYIINFYGRVDQHVDGHGVLRNDWADTQNLAAVAYDTPIPGFGNNTVNTMRLWAAKSTREFDLEYFNHGDYERAVSDKAQTETISKVLYPNDNVFEGKELRLKQEYFFVSATIQDIIRRYRKNRPHWDTFSDFNDKVTIQLNDTHPAIGIAELMRLLIDVHGLSWEKSWEITEKTFAYTNHTVLPEALEKWSVSLFELVLPRHMQIIFEINHRFLEKVRSLHPGDDDRVRRMSLIEETPEKKVRMAHLAIVGSHSVNGVSALHTEILKKGLFRDFFELSPEKFNNKTNGITQRRWIRLCNPDLSELINQTIGAAWIKDLSHLRNLENFSRDGSFRNRWMEIKQRNKKRLADYIQEKLGIAVHTDSIFDCHVKRIHEYKRQLLNALHIIYLYNRIKSGTSGDLVPRTFIFGGKAAPGYFMAKLIIKLINSVADVVNSDPEMSERLRVAFLENYSVSLAEKIIPSVDLSEQISTAGTEASGTGNMKFALNGALTIGTLDGANVEIMREVGKENIFIFGLTAREIDEKRRRGYDPLRYYNDEPDLKRIIDMIGSGFFSNNNPDLFRPLIDSLLGGDHYMVLADFKAYCTCQEEVGRTFRNAGKWAEMSILNVARMGYFSIDRTTQEYADEIWGAKPVPVSLS